MNDFIKPYNNDPFVGHLSTPVTNSKFTKAFLGNLPAYRVNLSNFLRGLEIGMAHGYFLLGPFDKLGPLRNSEFSHFAGFISTISLVTIMSLCLTIYGKVSFKIVEEKSSEANTSLLNSNLTSWKEFTSGFTIGALGGSSFAFLILQYS